MTSSTASILTRCLRWVPLSEVLRQLSEKVKLSDPERKGINFLINPNADQSGAAVAVPTGAGGAPEPMRLTRHRFAGGSGCGCRPAAVKS